MSTVNVVNKNICIPHPFFYISKVWQRCYISFSSNFKGATTSLLIMAPPPAKKSPKPILKKAKNGKMKFAEEQHPKKLQKMSKGILGVFFHKILS